MINCSQRVNHLDTTKTFPHEQLSAAKGNVTLANRNGFPCIQPCFK